MNRRTSKLLGYAATAMIQASKNTKSPKRRLKVQWNARPRPTRNVERLALIRALATLEAANG